LTDLLSLGIAQLATKLKNQKVSPIELVEDYISRINQINGKLNAFLNFSPDAPRRAAKIAEDEIKRGTYRGPLHGVPIGIKDLIDTSNMITTYGSAIYQNHIPGKDATVVSRLREAGAIILGKTNLHEFALGVTNENEHFGATKNPWDTERIPGGSSGGSAAAVAASMCCAAMGTDTGGSIRIPSAFCGLVGLKPTYGRVSTAGVFPLSIGLDHVGPITRSAVDAALMLQVIAGHDLNDPRSLMTPVPDFSRYLGRTVEKTKITISSTLIPEYLDPQIESAYEKAISKIESLGGEIMEKKLETSHLIEQVSTTLILAEAAAQHSELLDKSSDKYGANVLQRFRAGQKITTGQYIKALRNNEIIRREFEILFENTDFLLTPSVQILPPRIGEHKISTGTKELDVVSCCVRFTRLGNITGLPAIVIPFGYSTDGLPLSIQILGQRLHEPELLSLAHALEVATPELRNRHPQLH
jgi:aspartyl-tRNA(Asn)/glutamyl-tRNA(Gln) amidotransferase subunit A